MLETDDLVTPMDVAKKLNIHDWAGTSLTFTVIDAKTNKTLAEHGLKAEHGLNHDEDPVHIKLDVKGVDGIKFMVDPHGESSSATLSNPLLSE